MRRRTFMEAFDPYLQDATNLASRYFLQQGEDERELKRQQQEAQKQNDILTQLTKGTKSTFNYVGKFSPLLQSETPLTQQDYINLSSGASDDTLQRFNFLQGLRPEKKQQKTVTIGGKVYKESEDYQNVPQGDPLFEIPQEQKKPDKVWIMDENWGDKVKKLMGYENPEADPNDSTTRIKNGKKYTITDWTASDKYEKKTSSSGENRFSLKDEIKKSLGDYYKEQQKLLAITNAGFGNNVDKDGINYKDKLKNHNKIYSEAVKNNMTDSAKRWYDDIYNYQDENKQVGNPDPEDYWNILKQDYISGKLGKDPNKEDNYEDADFQILQENFKATYGFDPAQVYGY